MKKYDFLLLSTALFFSAIYSMDQGSMQQEEKRLLFPLPGKSADDLWQIVRANYEVYPHVLESLPSDIRGIIMHFWFVLNNPQSFSSPEDQFFRKLLGSCVTLNRKIKKMREDNLTVWGNFFINWEARTLTILDQDKQEVFRVVGIDAVRILNNFFLVYDGKVLK